MLFNADGVFVLEGAPDLRVRAALGAGAEQTSETLRPDHLLAGLIDQGDESLVAALSRAVRPGYALDDLVPSTNGHASSAKAPPSQRTRMSFTQEALRILDDFEAALQAGGGIFNKVTLELFAHCILVHLGEQERQSLTALDVDQAAALLWERVVAGIDGRPVTEMFRDLLRQGSLAATITDQPVLLPPAIAPSEDLTHRAQTAEMPPDSPFDGEPGYDQLFEAITRALHRRQAPHVLLCGERGVGKATVIAELARRAIVGKIPSLQGRRFLQVDCRHTPPEESRERLAAILNFAAERPDWVIVLNGLAALLPAERAAGNKAVLLAALSRVRCRLIALFTPREASECLSDDPEIAELFTRIEVEEPGVGAALKILRHFALGLEQRFGIMIEPEALRQAVVLSANYILNDQLPSKALKVLHRVCEDIEYERSHLGSARQNVTADDVVRVIAETSGVPEETLRGIAEKSDYEQSLREAIIGQDHAVREVAEELGLIKAGMTDPDKPASVLLFLGQTGTGKTEMAKALARFYSTSKRLKTYTLGNCVEPHSVATIIGVPPGYVGHDRGGRLINDLNTDPYCVFLLDEADKAHPDVLQPFLNLFDEGWVCDQRGVRAYANHSIFILTTNVGQRMIADLIQQGKSMEEVTARMKEALSQIRHSKSDRPVFTPEFLARIKRIIVFHSLDQSAMRGIARKLLTEMQRTWATKRSKRLEVPQELIEYLGDQAHRANERSSGKEGGRIVRKLISEWVEARIQRDISARPQEYLACSEVVLEFVLPEADPSGENPGAPAVRVRFR
jgi:ATP-dependent Clp protease ATP-binding subunit ClpA